MPSDGPKVNILLVDDQPSNLLVLEAILGDLGQNLVKASSGPQALRCCLDQDFALILMDAQMPGMDGFETAALIRERDRSRFTPVIFLTAYERTDVQMFKGYSVGAVDFMTKPIVPEVLRSKVAVFVELWQKTEEIKRQAELLRETERREHERQLAQEKQRYEAERLKQELRLAQQIQQRLFPQAPPRLDGLDIYGASYPAEATGGDYYDYLPLANGDLSLVIADVCGHGIGPALLMAATRAYLRALSLTHTNVGETLVLANRALVADVADGHFVTMMLARLDPRRRTLAYASAGHPRGYVLDAGGTVKHVLESTAVPLGLIQEGEFPEGPTVELAPGDLVFLLTDGMVDATNPKDEPFGIERVLNLVRRHQHQPARAIVEAVYRGVRDFARPHGHHDDVTSIAIKVQAERTQGSQS